MIDPQFVASVQILPVDVFVPILDRICSCGHRLFVHAEQVGTLDGEDRVRPPGGCLYKRCQCVIDLGRWSGW